jgi:hypothetical protein
MELEGIVGAAGMAVRLTDVQVVQVREKFAGGVRQVDLATEYGVAQNTVSSLVTGSSRHIAGGPISRSRARKLTPALLVARRSSWRAGTAEGWSDRTWESPHAAT